MKETGGESHTHSAKNDDIEHDDHDREAHPHSEGSPCIAHLYPALYLAEEEMFAEKSAKTIIET